jgi:hypothetical protein
VTATTTQELISMHTTNRGTESAKTEYSSWVKTKQRYTDSADGLFLIVVLDRPDVESAKESLHVTATSMLPGTAFTNTGASLIKDDGGEVKVSGQSVVGNFVWSPCCTDGFAASGFQDADGNFDVEIIFKHHTSKNKKNLSKDYYYKATARVVPCCLEEWMSISMAAI